MPSTEGKEHGELFEEAVAAATGGERRPDAWYDVETPDGRIHEAKSAQRRLASGRRGRFRLWLSQHQNLRDHGGAYHIFIYDDENGSEYDVGPDVDEKDSIRGHYVEIEPSDVDDAIEHNDLTWTTTGSHVQDYRQVKIPWHYLVDPAEVGE